MDTQQCNSIGGKRNISMAEKQEQYDSDFRRKEIEPLELSGRTATMVEKNVETGQGANLRGADLAGADLLDAILAGANLAGASLAEANLEGANLAGANLRGVSLRKANLQGVNFQKANLHSADLGKAILERANLQGADLQEADLEGADLEGTDLEGADLEGANLQGANLGGANLGKTNLGGTDLRGAIFLKTGIRKVKSFYKAKLDTKILSEIKTKWPEKLATIRSDTKKGWVIDDILLEEIKKPDWQGGWLEDNSSL